MALGATASAAPRILPTRPKANVPRSAAIVTIQAAQTVWHVISDPYPLTITQPTDFYIYCGATTYNSKPALTSLGEAYLYWQIVDMAQIIAGCTVVAATSIYGWISSPPVPIPVDPLPAPPSAFQVTP
jgi:hypothetical protein